MIKQGLSRGSRDLRSLLYTRRTPLSCINAILAQISIDKAVNKETTVCDCLYSVHQQLALIVTLVACTVQIQCKVLYFYCFYFSILASPAKKKFCVPVQYKFTATAVQYSTVPDSTHTTVQYYIYVL